MVVVRYRSELYVGANGTRGYPLHQHVGALQDGGVAENFNYVIAGKKRVVVAEDRLGDQRDGVRFFIESSYM